MLPSESTKRSRWMALTLASLVALTGCDFGKSGGGSTNAPEGPAKPQYERAFDEFSDVPNQITKQVEWAAQPLADAAQLADEIAALRAKLKIDDETFQAMFKVALKDGKIELGAQTEIQAAKAEVEALLTKIKQVGADLQALPSRVKVATKNISSLAMSTPKLALNSTKELGGQLSAAVGDGAVQIKADLETVKKLPNEVKTQAIAAKDVLAELPAKAEASTRNLLAAIAGKPYEKQPSATEGLGSDASADTGTVVADSSGSTSTTSTTPPPPTGSAGSSAAAMMPSGPVEPLAPASIIAARVKALQRSAASAGQRGDWFSAAELLEEAYVLMPNNQLLAFEIGDAAVKAHDCPRAQTYYDRFLKYGDGNANPDQYLAAKKAIGELKTFDCPVRTASDEALVAQTLALRAESLGGEDDWGGAALQYALAYQRAPKQHIYAFQVALASWKARECRDAVDYFEHFRAVGDPKVNRKQMREANQYVVDAEEGDCQPLDSTTKDALARKLYAQGQSLEVELDFLTAAGKYERAYVLLPNNHAFAFRMAESYWAAQYCEQAEPHYRAFVANVTDPRYADDLGKAKQILGRIETHGCPNALWNTTVSAAATPSAGASDSPASSGSGGGGGGDVPTTSSGGGAAHCSVAPTNASDWPWFVALVALVGLRRRPRRHMQSE